AGQRDPVVCESATSTIDQLLHLRVAALTLHQRLRKQVVDLAQIVCCPSANREQVNPPDERLPLPCRSRAVAC
ncbi:MAG: hypothetical protein WBW61_06455, partial [Rhodanobacteraceae bacterium]